jgi:hypothetical protein
MHGGFENETPNIPTNSIMKIDMMNLFKQSPILAQKLEQAIGTNGARPSSMASTKPMGTSSGSTSPSDNGGTSTPPMGGIARPNDRIRMCEYDVEGSIGVKPSKP